MINCDNDIRVLVIGCGPHATHFYLPAFRRFGGKWGAKVTAILDIESEQKRVSEEFRNYTDKPRLIFVRPSGFEELSPEVTGLLDDLLAKGLFNAVVISTDPVNHKNYAKWALERELPVLMDKPVTTRENVVTDAGEADGILRDYDELLALHRCQKTPRPFILTAHRRYHPGILHVRKIIREVAEKTGCPVTNIHSAHSDGQWRLPHEICTQKHHSYNQGHGKVSHSGFHFIDCVEKFWEEGLSCGKKADDVEVTTSFLRPRGLINQLGRGDYTRLFGEDYEKACPETDCDLWRMFEPFGEVDAEISMAMRHDEEPFSLASISLIHNGFSRRSWLLPGKDLYKGNGRVKHEDHVVHIGPFAVIQVHSYQSKDDHELCTQEDDAPGGNNHYEIYVFRNTKMIGGAPFESITLRDLENASDFSDERLYITQVKERAIEEWIQAILKGRPDEKDYLSAFSDHRMSVSLMAAIYRSYIQKQQGGSPVFVVPWAPS